VAEKQMIGFKAEISLVELMDKLVLLSKLNLVPGVCYVDRSDMMVQAVLAELRRALGSALREDELQPLIEKYITEEEVKFIGFPEEDPPVNGSS
jgi:hypothetical protein